MPYRHEVVRTPAEAVEVQNKIYLRTALNYRFVNFLRETNPI